MAIWRNKGLSEYFLEWWDNSAKFAILYILCFISNVVNTLCWLNDHGNCPQSTQMSGARWRACNTHKSIQSSWFLWPLKYNHWRQNISNSTHCWCNHQMMPFIVNYKTFVKSSPLSWIYYLRKEYHSFFSHQLLQCGTVQGHCTDPSAQIYQKAATDKLLCVL